MLKKTNTIVSESIDFTPKKCKPYEIYIGNCNGKDAILNMGTNPHLIAVGIARSGKTKMIDQIITNLIYNNNDNDVEIFICQNYHLDLYKFKDCKEVTFKHGDLIDIRQGLDDVVELINSRQFILKDLISEYKGDSIFDYNRLNPSKKIPYIYVIIDEYMEIVERSNDSREDKFTKRLINKNLQKIVQYGRSCGVFLILSTIKATHDLLSSFLLNQIDNRMVFMHYDSNGLQRLIGHELAQYTEQLKPREFIFKDIQHEAIGVTTNITNELIAKFINKD